MQGLVLAAVLVSGLLALQHWQLMLAYYDTAGACPGPSHSFAFTPGTVPAPLLVAEANGGFNSTINAVSIPFPTPAFFGGDRVAYASVRVDICRPCRNHPSHAMPPTPAVSRLVLDCCMALGWDLLIHYSACDGAVVGIHGGHLPALEHCRSPPLGACPGCGYLDAQHDGGHRKR